MRKIQYKLLGQQHFANCKDGESPIVALLRSIKSQPRVGRVLAPRLTPIVDHSDRVIGYEAGITVCGKRAKDGSWPIMSEFQVNISA